MIYSLAFSLKSQKLNSNPDKCEQNFSERSVLLTETMQWTQDFDHVKDFLSFSFGCTLELFPTLFGMHVAEDIEIGSTR